MLRRFLSTSTKTITTKSTKSIKNNKKINKKLLKQILLQQQLQSESEKDINVYPPIFAIGIAAIMYTIYSSKNKYS